MNVSMLRGAFVILAIALAAGCTGRPIGEFAYVAVVNGNFEVYRARVGSAPGINLTRDPALDYRPTWSWHGDRIFFYSDRAGNRDVFTMDVYGGDLRNLTKHPARDSSPAEGPDGRIAFVSDRDGNRELYLMNSDGSGPRRLTFNDHYDDAPAWSPDGTRIAFSSIPEEDGDIHLLTVATGEIRRLCEVPGHDDSPSWSPDGRKIAFHGSDGETVSIYVVRVDGSDMRRIPNERPDERHPRWSPDGRWLLYTATIPTDSEVNTDVWMMRPDGSERRALVATPNRDEYAVWKPR